MRLLLYVAKVVGAMVALTTVCLVALVAAVALVENAAQLNRIETGAASAAMKLGIFSAANYAHQILPVSTFLGVLVAGVLLARNGELLAIEAAGVSPKKPLLGFALVAVCVGIFAGAFGEWVVPWALRGLEEIRHQGLEKRDRKLDEFFRRRLGWYQIGDYVLYIPSVDLKAQVFHQPAIYRVNGGRVQTVIEGERLAYEDGAWRVHDAMVLQDEAPYFRESETVTVDLPVEPRSLIDVTGNPRLMATFEIRELIRRRESAGFDSTAHRLEFFGRFSYPILVMALFALAVPFALLPERRRSMAVTLGVGVSAVAGLLLVLYVFRWLSLGGKVPELMGAFGPALALIIGFPLSAKAAQRKRTYGRVF